MDKIKMEKNKMEKGKTILTLTQILNQLET